MTKDEKTNGLDITGQSCTSAACQTQHWVYFTQLERARRASEETTRADSSSYDFTPNSSLNSTNKTVRIVSEPWLKLKRVAQLLEQPT